MFRALSWPAVDTYSARLLVSRTAGVARLMPSFGCRFAASHFDLALRFFAWRRRGTALA